MSSPRCSRSCRPLCAAMAQPLPFSFLLIAVYAVGVVACWHTSESWFSKSLPRRSEQLTGYSVNQVIDISLAGFCGALFIHFAIMSCLPGRRKHKSQRIGDWVTLIAMFAQFATHVLSAVDLTATLTYASGVSGSAVMIRPLKVFQILCTASCIDGLGTLLSRELRIMTDSQALFHHACLVGAHLSILAASVCSWSLPAYIACTVLFLCAMVRPMEDFKALASAVYKANDHNTRVLLHAIGPVFAICMWPGALTLLINLAGGAGAMTSNAAEATSSALYTVGMSTTLLLWSARASEEVSASLAVELHKVEQQSAAADARNDAKRSFMRYIFHELRVPLNSIMLGLQDMAETAAEVPTGPVHTGEADGDIAIEESAGSSVLASFVSGVTDTANLLIGNATAMRKLLDDFLSLEKIEEGKFELEPVVFRVHDIVKEATRMFAAPCATKGLKLVADTSTPVPETIRGDVHKLRQVLCNFISNAIKFSPHGATITVSTMSKIAVLQRSVPEACVVLSVIDQGVGISKADQAKLFQPFNQIKAGALQKGNGTGLGLSICKRIVELSGGIVGCASAEGKGSRFYFQVPVDGPSTAGASTAAAVDQPVAVVINGSQPSSPFQAASSGQGEVDGNDRTPEAASGLSSSLRRASSVSVALGRPQSSARIAPSPMLAPSSSAGLPPTTPQPHLALTVETNSRAAATDGAGFSPADNTISRNSRAPLVHSTASSAVSYRRPADSDASDERPPSRSDSVVSASLIHADTSASASALRINVSTPKSALLTHAVVVDDVKSNRDMFGRMLARRGVTTIHYAEDGLQAVAFLDNLLDADLNRIQAWFLDKEMPNCDGHECAQHLRARGITAPVFGVTGNALAEDRRLFIAAGVDAVITKPVSMDAIESALSQHGLRLLPPPTSSSTPSSRASTPGARRPAH